MITCGNCRNQHQTAAQVRACYQVKTVGFSHHPKARRTIQAYPSTTRWAKANMDTDWTQAMQDKERAEDEEVARFKMERDRAMGAGIKLVSEPQAKFIFDLTNTIASITGADGIKVTTEEFWGQLLDQGLTWESASKAIDLLKEGLASERAKQAPKAKGSGPAVPNGRYAVEEDGVLKFFKVNTPEEGRWEGFTFVDIIASDTPYPIKNRERRKAILATIAEDAQAAMLRYGVELGHCGHCGRPLTNEESRALGIGPVCRSKMGW